MRHSPKSSQNQKSSTTMPVDAKLFLLALRSYPERFRSQPNLSFEQYCWKLATAPLSEFTHSHAAGK